MSLQLNISNTLIHLANKICKDLKGDAMPVFQPHYIITQTDGMNNWLKLQIANHNKIAANILFRKPNDIIHQIYYLLGGAKNHTAESPSAPWIIYHILGEPEFKLLFKTIAAYYGSDKRDKDIKRLALSEKIADLFDQYQVYRPELITNWNNSLPGHWNVEDWQHYIWHRLKEMTGNSLTDKTIISDYIIHALKDDKHIAKIQSRIPVIHLFGLSVTTNFHFNIFNFLSEKIDVKYYLQNPSPLYYWFDDKSDKQLAVLQRKGFIERETLSAGNSLLLNWGRVIGDTFSLLFQNESLLNTYNETGILEPLKDTLLHKLQNDIFHNADDETRILLQPTDCTDESITINSCYTPAREVEVLYNYLVYLIDKRKEQLSPGDIVVMVTNIDEYAPFIKAVFGYAPYKFKFSIADESINSGDTVVNALQAVLSLNKTNCTAENVVQLLDFSLIRKRFGISDLALLRKVVDKAGIRFGINGNADDDTLFVSWSYGINRIVNSICIAGEEAVIADGGQLYLIDLPDGAEANEVIRFVHFLQVVIDFINKRKVIRTIVEWVSYVDDVLQNILWDKDVEAEDEIHVITEELDKLNLTGGLITDKYSFETFVHGFMHNIIGVKRTGTFAYGGITFCSLIPMRSIPFKVVAILGMNFDKFPRREVPISFNLMEKQRKKGDRNVKDNDKHLFLETLMSAQKYLYISYAGRSVKDNTLLPPSAILDELLDYIQKGCSQNIDIKQLMIHEHPLHNFSQKYNSDTIVYNNYLNVQHSAHLNSYNADDVSLPQQITQIEAEEIIKFFKHPVKYYYNNILKIRYESDSVLLNETEVFELDHLQKWQLRNEILSLDESGVLQLKNKLLKTSLLPLKNMADIVIQEIEEEVQPLKKLFQQCVAGASQQTLVVDYDIGNYRLTGNIPNTYHNKIIVVSFSKNEVKYMVDAVIMYVIALMQYEDVSIHFISSNMQKIYKGIQLSRNEAYEILQKYIELFLNGQKNMLLYNPAFNIEPQQIDKLDLQSLEKKLKGVVDNKNKSHMDFYLINEIRNKLYQQDDCVEKLKENCKIILQPLLQVFPDYFK